MKQGDLAPSLTATLYQGSNPIDLTGASVAFKLKTPSGTVRSAACAIVSATTGLVRYDWTAGDTDAAGQYLAEFVVTFSTGDEMTLPTVGTLTVSIEPRLA